MAIPKCVHQMPGDHHDGIPHDDASFEHQQSSHRSPSKMVALGFWSQQTDSAIFL